MKVTYLREDLLTITGNYKEAMVLDFMLRACDYNEDMWLAQTLEEISEGSQLWTSQTATCRYIGELVRKGLVEEHGRRRRVLVGNLRKELERVGYKLVRV